MGPSHGACEETEGDTRPGSWRCLELWGLPGQLPGAIGAWVAMWSSQRAGYSFCGYMYVHTCTHAFNLWPANRALKTKVGGSHPLVVDGEVVIQADNALGLAQEAAVGGFSPPVQQVSRAVILAPCIGNASMPRPSLTLRPGWALGSSSPTSQHQFTLYGSPSPKTLSGLTPVIVAMGQFMPNDGADAPVVQRPGPTATG